MHLPLIKLFSFKNAGRCVVAFVLFMGFFAGPAFGEGEKKKESCAQHKVGEGPDYGVIKKSKETCDTSLEMLGIAKESVAGVKGKLSSVGRTFTGFSGTAVDAKSSIESSKAMMNKSVSELEAGKKQLDTISGNVGRVQEVSGKLLSALSTNEASLSKQKAELESKIKANQAKLTDFEKRFNHVSSASAAAPDNFQMKQNLSLLQSQRDREYFPLKKLNEDLAEQLKKKTVAIADHGGARKDQGAVNKNSGALAEEIKKQKSEVDSSISGLKSKIAELDKAKLGENESQAKGDDKDKKADESKTPEQVKAEGDKKAMEGMTSPKFSEAPKEGKALTENEKALEKATEGNKEAAMVRAGAADGKTMAPIAEGNKTLTVTEVTDSHIAGSQRTKDDLISARDHDGGSEGATRDLKLHVEKMDEIDKKLNAMGPFDANKPPEAASELIAERKALSDSIKAQPRLAIQAGELGIKERTIGETKEVWDRNDYEVDAYTGEKTKLKAADKQTFAKDDSAEKALKTMGQSNYGEQVEENFQQKIANADTEIERAANQQKQDLKNHANAESRATATNAFNAGMFGDGMGGGGESEITAKDQRIVDLGDTANKFNYGAGVAGARVNDEAKGDLARGMTISNAKETIADAVMLPGSMIPGIGSGVDIYRTQGALEVARGDQIASGFAAGAAENVAEKTSARNWAVGGAVADVAGGAVVEGAVKGAKAAGRGMEAVSTRFASSAESVASNVGETAARTIPEATRIAPEVARVVPNESSSRSLINVSEESTAKAITKQETVSVNALPAPRETGLVRGSDEVAESLPAKNLSREVETPRPAKLVDAEDTPLINAPASARIADDSPAAQIKPKQAKLVDNYEPAAPARIGLENAPRIEAPPTTVARAEANAGRPGNDSNAVDLNSRRLAEPSKGADSTPVESRSRSLSNETTQPKLIAGRIIRTQEVEEAANFTSSLAKAFSPVAESAGTAAGACLTAAARTALA
ncbi:MAG: hypothetical protein EOP11_06040, partial [Proteobacteria bacterium]